MLLIYAFIFALVAETTLTAQANRVVAPFRLPSAQQSANGARQYHAIERAAMSEGLWDRLWGNDCFSRALREFGKECRDLLPSQKSRLAFALTRCQLMVQGETDESRLLCKPSSLLKSCLDRLDDRENALYVEMLGSVDVTCLFLQNLNFEQNAERVLNDLVAYGSQNSELASKMRLELSGMLALLRRQNGNLTTVTAKFASHMEEMRETLAQTAADIAKIFSDIHSDAMIVKNFQKSMKDDINALIEIQRATSESLQGIASDISRRDVAFYAVSVLILVLATSVGIPAKPRALFFCWIVSVVAIERAFYMTAPSKTLVRKAVGLVVLTGWFIFEWRIRVSLPKGQKKRSVERPMAQTIRRSPRARCHNQ